MSDSVVILPTAALERLLKVDAKTINVPAQAMVKDLGELALRTAISKAPGTQLPASIMPEVTPLMARVHTPLKQAHTIESGRKPNRRMPPIEAIDQWGLQHGLPYTVTYAIARSIGQRGFKGRFFMRKAKAAVRREIPARLQKLASDIEAKFG